MSTHHDWWGYIKAVIRRYPGRKDRHVSGVAACEKGAVRAAVEATERRRDGYYLTGDKYGPKGRR